MKMKTIIPDEQDFAEIDLLDETLSPADRFSHAQNLKFHRLAELAGFDEISGESGKPN
jgi:hypothetical protein